MNFLKIPQVDTYLKKKVGKKSSQICLNFFIQVVQTNIRINQKISFALKQFFKSKKKQRKKPEIRIERVEVKKGVKKGQEGSKHNIKDSSHYLLCTQEFLCF